jgi:putative peptidoglycan lipid II flippase
MFIGLPASAGMVFIALPAVRLLFEHRQFTYADSLLTARSTAIYSCVIWAFSVQQILNRGYYALHDMRTPLVWAAANLAINLIVEIPLLWTPLAESAMAVGTAASFIVQTTVMAILLARRVDLRLSEIRGPLTKMLLATAGMAMICAPIRYGVRWPDSTMGHGLSLMTTMVAGAAAYFGLCAMLRLPMQSLLPRRRRAASK